MVLCEARRIFKAFPIEGGLLRRRTGLVQALQDVSVQLHSGETLAVVGGSGCGKSTLAKIIMGLLAPDSGELLWEGQPVTSWNRLERARRIQMIFQDPYASLNPKLSIETQLAEVVRLGADPKAGKRLDARSRCIELLESVGLSQDVLAHYPFQFSGGQRQRIAIARALAMQPQLLIADEPLSALDVTVQAQILGLFGRLKADLGLTLLFITHDLAVASHAADRVLVLENGRMVEEGPTASTLRHPIHPYTRALLAAVPQIPC